MRNILIRTLLTIILNSFLIVAFGQKKIILVKSTKEIIISKDSRIGYTIINSSISRKGILTPLCL